MLQDILPKKYDNNYYADKVPDDNAICLIFKDSYVLTGHKECEGTRYIPEESASSLEKNAPAGDVFFPKYGQIKDCVEKIEILPYHTLGEYKYEKMGMKYKLEGVPAMTAERAQEIRKIMAEYKPCQ